MDKEKAVLVEVGNIKMFLGAVVVRLSSISGLEPTRANVDKALEACDRINTLLVQDDSHD